MGNALKRSFLLADPQQPMQRRMRAAEAAVPFVHPKLSVAANVYSFAAQMEELKQRLRLRRSVASLSLFDDRQN